MSSAVCTCVQISGSAKSRGYRYVSIVAITICFEDEIIEARNKDRGRRWHASALLLVSHSDPFREQSIGPPGWSEVHQGPTPSQPCTMSFSYVPFLPQLLIWAPHVCLKCSLLAYIPAHLVLVFKYVCLWPILPCSCKSAAVVTEFTAIEGFDTHRLDIRFIWTQTHLQQSFDISFIRNRTHLAEARTQSFLCLFGILPFDDPCDSRKCRCPCPRAQQDAPLCHSSGCF